MENLNKENFWNAMHEKYPNAMGEFCKWIDEYKETVGWHQLFSKPLSESDKKAIEEMWQAVSDIPHHSDNEDDRTTAFDQAVEVEKKMHRQNAPKFHDLPLAMQMGIFHFFFKNPSLEEIKEETEAVLYALNEGIAEREAAGE